MEVAARAELETLRMCECIDSREWKDASGTRQAATIAGWRRETNCTSWAGAGVRGRWIARCDAVRTGVHELEVWLELRECEADALLVAIEDG